MFGWLRKLRHDPPPPEARWAVEVDGESIRVTDEAGESRAVAKAEMAGVAIETGALVIEARHGRRRREREILFGLGMVSERSGP